MIHAVTIGEQGVGDGTHIEQAIPIGVTARQARNLQPEQDSHSPESDLSIQVIESGTFYKHLARHTKIFVDRGHLALDPAQRNCFLYQRVLPRCGLAVVLDLRRMGLTNIDNGVSSRVRGFYFADINHLSLSCFGLGSVAWAITRARTSIATACCSFSNVSQTWASGMGRSTKFRLRCTMVVLLGNRFFAAGI